MYSEIIPRRISYPMMNQKRKTNSKGKNASLSNNVDGSKPSWDIVLAMQFPLDRAAYQCLFETRNDIRLLATTGNLNEAAAYATNAPADVVVLDARFPDRASFVLAEKLTAENSVRGVLILDCCLREGSLSHVLQLQSVGYATRSIEMNELCFLISQLAEGKAAFEETIEHRLTRRPHKKTTWKKAGEQNTKNRFANSFRFDGEHAFQDLSDREIDVVRALASGISLKDVAKQLQLSTSTVDNHKTKAMRKLGVHKASLLTRIAIRHGLIDP